MTPIQDGADDSVRARLPTSPRLPAPARGSVFAALAPAAPLLDLAQDQETQHAREDAADDAGEDLAGQDHPERVQRAHERRDPGPGADREALWVAYSHSIVPGGLLVMSSTTRFTSRISLIIREAICSSRSYGSRAQSAVIASSDVTARIATT
jgi:hypothetical protein